MAQGWNTLAVVIEGPERLALNRLSLPAPAPDEILVDIEWSGISTLAPSDCSGQDECRRFPGWVIRWFRDMNPSAVFVS